MTSLDGFDIQESLVYCRECDARWTPPTAMTTTTPRAMAMTDL